MTEHVTVEEVQRNGTILCLDVPEGTEFGIDYQSWIIGSQFKGVKLIPPGVHFVYYKYVNSPYFQQFLTSVSAVSKYGDTATRSSFFINLQSGETIVRRWNPQNETLDKLDEDEADRYCQGKFILFTHHIHILKVLLNLNSINTWEPTQETNWQIGWRYLLMSPKMYWRN
jgi:A1 cistron-splicing factor AAR2